MLLIKQRSASKYSNFVVIITLSDGELKCEMTDNYWLLRCWVKWDSSHLLTYDVLLRLVARRLMTMMHYSYMLLLHSHYVNDLFFFKQTIIKSY